MRSAVALLLLAAACGLPHPSDPYRVTVDVGPWMHDLATDDEMDRVEARSRLEALGEAGFPALRAGLHREPPSARVGICEAVWRLGLTDGVPILIEAAHDPAPDVRQQAMLGLGHIGDLRGRPVVEAGLDDPSSPVRLAAALSCRAPDLCVSPAALARLVDIAIHDDIPNSLWARAALVHIMGRGGETAQVVQANIERTAVPAVAAGSLDERARAAILASDIGNAAGAKVLNEAAIKASNPQLRQQAIYALGRVGDASAVPVLAGLLRQPDTDTSNYSYQALTSAAARGIPEAQHALEAYHGPRPTQPVAPPPP